MFKLFMFCTAIFIGLQGHTADPETLVFSFQKQKNPDEIQKTASQVADFLSKEIGLKVDVLIPTSYGTTAQGMISKKVHVAYMDSLPFILASNEAQLEITAVEKRKGKTSYDSIIVVPVDSTAKSLKDLKGKTFAFTSQTSTSGYLYPFARLVKEKEIKSPADLAQYFSQISYAGGYDKALLAVAKGQAQAAAVSDYAFEGEKSDLYIDAVNKAKLKILTRTPGVPTHLIAVSKDLSEALRAKIQNALLRLSKEKPELLSSVYGAAELVKADNTHVKNTELALKDTQLEPKAFVK